MVVQRTQTWLERWGTFLFKYRDAVFPAVMLGTIAIKVIDFPYSAAISDVWLDVTGVLLCILGQLMRIWVIGYRYIVRGGKNRQVHAEDLVTDGIFALARNPLYVGNILVLFGIFIIWNAPLLYLIGVPFTLFGYAGIVAAEEAFLRAKFGQAYEDYCRTTNRWIPDLRKRRTAIDGIPFNWRRVLLREYGSWTAWIGTAGAMIIAESLYAAPYADQAPLINAIIAVMAVVFVAWAITRWLKLNKRIRA